MTHIPLVDLGRQLDEILPEVMSGWKRVIDDSAYILGGPVAAFESAFADFCDTKFCLGVANGTDAIELALRACGIGSDDEVLLPANTFVATALAVLRAGAQVRLVDCEPGSYLIDPKSAIESRTSATKAIIPVHLFGQMAPCDELQEAMPDLIMIEDAAQAQGARRHGRAIGSFGVAAATSFYPGKNLGAWGDAGAVLTNHSEVATRLAALRNWGSTQKYHHPEIGFNSRLDTLQAVVLSAKLARLAQWNEERGKAANLYDQMLADRVRIPTTLPGNDHVFHLYVVEIDNRDAVLAKMQQAGVGVGVHYPVPIHLQGAMSHLGYRNGEFPHTERAAQRMLSLPIFPGITEGEQTQVVETLFRSLLAAGTGREPS